MPPVTSVAPTIRVGGASHAGMTSPRMTLASSVHSGMTPPPANRGTASPVLSSSSVQGKHSNLPQVLFQTFYQLVRVGWVQQILKFSDVFIPHFP